MDLSFARFDKGVAVTALPTELAVLLVGVATRQASSATARAQARIGRPAPVPNRLKPASGAFNAPLAATLARLDPSVKLLFTYPF